jgi:hypothetical protein
MGLTLISGRLGGEMMDPSVTRTRRDYPFIVSILGGALVCLDYTLDIVFIATLLSTDSSLLGAVPLVLAGLTCGLAMVAGAYFGRSRSERKWPYLLLGSSLLALFMPYLTVISAVGGVLGSAASTYLLSKRRMMPPVKRA